MGTTGRRRPLRWVVAAAVVLVAAGGLVVLTRDRAGPPTAAGTVEAVLAVGDVERSYRLYRPVALAESPALVLVLHGGGGSAEQAQASYGWDDLADREGFAVAYPAGLHRTWNAGGCCGRAVRDDVDDVAFLTGLVDVLVAELSADPDRVHVAGMSNGAMMGYALACATDRLAALGAVAGSMLVECAHPAPLSVAHVHGTADTSVLLTGGTGSGPGRVTAPPLAEVMSRWRDVDACAAPVQARSGALLTESAACPDGRAVELVTISGAGHQWPGSTATRARADPPSDALDATEYLWAFFAAHPRP